ncbi:hypothetical protein CTI12_AA189520 [Artemisia annua]|uniref:Uncharacterized protein n=1 Tax=Artemisia annua TaxID=35608 RepID=A0A2U1P6C4_ARTAN|nr:hypothetical protein CTI12_AA189520 [Artemisia annua]
MGTQEKLISDMSNGVTEDAILETKKEHLTNLSADAREIGDESGLDLFDDNNRSIYFEIPEGITSSNTNAQNILMLLTSSTCYKIKTHSLPFPS